MEIPSLDAGEQKADMITELKRPPKRAAWQQALAEGVADPRQLLELLNVRADALNGELDLDSPFPLRVPKSFIRRMRPADPADPLLMQVLSSSLERTVVPGYRDDPVADRTAQRGPGLLQKYADRVLLITTGACPIHCRYCFRRHYPYSDAPFGRSQWQSALEFIKGDPTIKEVILSGGDPLMLSDGRLAELTARLNAIPHVARLRMHTRFPIVMPERIDGDLERWVAALRLPLVMVLHANHANEINQEVAEAVARLRTAGVTVLNQSVLLRGVNADVGTLVALSEQLFAAGILPYYLHLLDRVSGAAHFEVDDATAARLLDGLRTALPGYLVPKMVREMSGALYKTPLN